MRILTYNHLKSPVKGVQKGYPLLIEIEELEVAETEELDESKIDFIRSVLPDLDWEGVLLVSKQIEGFQGILPDLFDESLLADDNFVEAMYRLLIDINIVKGKLICPESGKIFPIENGLPCMM